MGNTASGFTAQPPATWQPCNTATAAQGLMQANKQGTRDRTCAFYGVGSPNPDVA